MVNTITVTELSKEFPNSSVALDKINFTAKNGEFIALLGANGAGKTTLFRCFTGLEQVNTGSIVINGTEIVGISKKKLRNVRQEISVIFQHFNLVDNLSVFHNVLLGGMGKETNPLNWWPITAKKHNREKVMRCLQRVNLLHLASQRTSYLSGGEQQRVAIARLLMQEPKIIFADEPVASLDPRAGEEIMELFKKIVKEENITLVCILHQLDFAFKYADRIICLQNGKLVIDGDPLELDRNLVKSVYNYENKLSKINGAYD